jgi:hypothetical protein
MLGRTIVFLRRERIMSVKRSLLVVSVVSAVLLSVGMGPGRTSTVQARPLLPASTVGDGAIAYTGKLADKAGQPVANGLYDFFFALYATENGGEPLWWEVQKDVAVEDGALDVALGRAKAIPSAVLDGSPRWLAVGVRGPSEAAFTSLLPRQRLSTAPAAAPASSTANGACPHDHVGEVWNANITWSNAGLRINNSANGPALWGSNTGGGNGLRGTASGAGLGVYGEGGDGAGVAGRSTNGNGIEGYASSSGMAGVYAENNVGYGVYARSDNGWGVYCQGDMRVTENFRVWGTSDLHGYVTFYGGKSGYVVEIAQNDDAIPLEVGDVVVISGVAPAVVGEIPVIQVRRTASGESSGVVGVVDKHYVPAASESTASSETEHSGTFAEAPVAPGEYLSVVTLGSYKAIKVDASYGPIAPGDRLVASPNPGYAMRADSPQPGTLIGKALGTLPSGTGVIPVIVTLQ